MQGRKIFFIAGNEMPRSSAALLENLICHKKQKQETPLFIEVGQTLVFSSKKRERVKEKKPLHFDYFPSLEMTVLPLDKLQKEWKNVKKDELLKTEMSFSSIFVYAEMNQDTLPVLSKSDYIVFIIKNDSYSSGYLYTALKLLKENEINYRGGVIISGIRYIEEAADYYVKLKKEVAALLGEQPNCDFLGFYYLDIPMLTHAQQKSQPLIKVFPESGFHGLIKYIDRQLQDLKTLVHEDSFFLSFCKE